jgi:hypothetical protein
MPVGQPVPLSGSGLPLAAPVNSSNAVYLNFQIYDAIPYGTSFGFPAGTFV